MAIHDLVTPFIEFSSRPADEGAPDRWDAEVVTADAAFYRAVRPWVDPTDAPTRLPGLIERRDELRARLPRAQHAIRKAHDLLTAALPGTAPLRAVVMVGLGAANGWATDVDGEPTLFVAIDRLPEPGYDAVLALHELVHVEHLRRAAAGWPEDQVAANLVREGLAVHATTELMPDIEASGHLWFEPGRQPWINRCRGARRFLLNRLSAELTDDERDGRWFSGSADRPGDLPGRCGYWLGWQLMKSAARGRDLDDLMNQPLDEVIGRLRHQLLAA